MIVIPTIPILTRMLCLMFRVKGARYKVHNEVYIIRHLFLNVWLNGGRLNSHKRAQDVVNMFNELS